VNDTQDMAIARVSLYSTRLKMGAFWATSTALVTALAALTLAGPVSASDTNTTKLLSTINVASPWGIAVDERRGTVYVTSGSSVSVINEDTDKVTAVIPVAGFGFAIALDPYRGKVYTASYTGQVVSVIDEASNSVTKTISLPCGSTLAVAVDPYRGKAYVGCGNLVEVIDEGTDTISTSITLPYAPQAQGLAVDPIRGILYAAAGPIPPYALYAIDEDTATVSATTISMPTQSNGLAVDPIGGRVYVPNEGFIINETTSPYAAATVTVVDEHTNEITATIPSGYRTFAVAFDPLNQTLYAVNEGYTTASANGLGITGPTPASLAVIDTVSNKVTDTIPLTPFATDVGVDSVRRKVYVSEGGGVVAVFSVGAPRHWIDYKKSLDKCDDKH